MPNTNFQTIFQMGQAINAMVKQATGRDVVKEIEMGQVTVAQNHISIEHTYSGDVVSFVTDDEYPMKIVTDINPVQDFNGYGHPWAGGTGKNKLKFDTASFAVNGTGLTCTYTEDGVITISGKATSTNYIGWVFPIKAGTYIISGGYDSSNFSMCVRDSNTAAVLFNSRVTGAGETQFTVPQNYAQVSFSITVTNGTNMGTGHEIKPMIRDSSVSDSSFEPYSNICPITGWTATRITVSPSDDPEEGTVYSITYASEANPVYGGTLTVKKDGTAVLVVDRAIVDLGDLEWSYNSQYEYFVSNGGLTGLQPRTGYNNSICTQYKQSPEIYASRLKNGEYFTGANNVSAYIKDMSYSDAAMFKTAMAGVKIVYPLAEPVTDTLTVGEIETLIGENVVSADTGNISVSYDEIIEGGGN